MGKGEESVRWAGATWCTETGSHTHFDAWTPAPPAPTPPPAPPTPAALAPADAEAFRTSWYCSSAAAALE